eukprot:TRINITY_DN11394_c0_g1_i4.p1 TRINITY_DN11394_c0_g1~~TRINITY_DN11394_c0_g1_i4.p1  ORF type:complete len:364 (-),score=55.77 TRINITY_DN11394_c0_g1_i4:28-1119(-)
MASLTSILGYEAPDDVVEAIKAFFARYAAYPDVEFEGKFGIFQAKAAGASRYDPKVTTMAVLDSTRPDYFFKAEVEPALFQSVNRMMNQRVQSYSSLVKCTFTTEHDQFHHDKTRVSKDRHGNVLRCIRKHRLEDLNIYSPTTGLDFRISASSEEPAPEPHTPCHYQRTKNRISYAFEIWRLDMTEVFFFAGDLNQNVQPTYEIELEILDMQCLRTEFDKYQRGQQNYFHTLARSFLANLKTLAMFSNPPEKLPPPLPPISMPSHSHSHSSSSSHPAPSTFNFSYDTSAGGEDHDDHSEPNSKKRKLGQVETASHHDQQQQEQPETDQQYDEDDEEDDRLDRISDIISARHMSAQFSFDQKFD